MCTLTILSHYVQFPSPVALFFKFVDRTSTLVFKFSTLLKSVDFTTFSGLTQSFLIMPAIWKSSNHSTLSVLGFSGMQKFFPTSSPSSPSYPRSLLNYHFLVDPSPGKNSQNVFAMLYSTYSTSLR